MYLVNVFLFILLCFLITDDFITSQVRAITSFTKIDNNNEVDNGK